MRSIGTVRKVDDLGRIVLPKEVRVSLRMNERDPVEIFVEGDTVILRKFEISCILCGSIGGLKDFKGKKVCSECVDMCSDL